MDILYLLIPLSSVLVLAILGVFAWAIAHGQFDDIDCEGERIVELDDAQARHSRFSEESPAFPQAVPRGED